MLAGSFREAPKFHGIDPRLGERKDSFTIEEGRRQDKERKLSSLIFKSSARPPPFNIILPLWHVASRRGKGVLVGNFCTLLCSPFALLSVKIAFGEMHFKERNPLTGSVIQLKFANRSSQARELPAKWSAGRFLSLSLWIFSHPFVYLHFNRRAKIRGIAKVCEKSAPAIRAFVKTLAKAFILINGCHVYIHLHPPTFYIIWLSHLEFCKKFDLTAWLFFIWFCYEYVQ